MYPPTDSTEKLALSAGRYFPPTRSGLRLGLGGAAIGNLFSAVTDAEARAVVDAALADGCATFDTAPHYGQGLSEHRLGSALRGLSRDSFALSSKVGRVLVADSSAPREQNSYVDVLPFSQQWDYSAAGVRRSVEDSLQRLGMSRLDAVYVHDCDRHCHPDRYAGVLQQVIREALPELQRMKREGLVRAIGLGVNDVEVCLDVLAAADLDVLMLAGRYSLLDHSGLDLLLPLCSERGVRVALGGVFNSGILATGTRSGNGAPMFNYAAAPAAWIERTQKLEALCELHGVPLRAAALQFPLAHPAVEIVMLGARKVSEWQDAMKMMQHPIPSAFWEALRRDLLVPEAAPLPGLLA
ncbi:MAG: aldo/keto reductase [Pseudomonadota bacterium]